MKKIENRTDFQISKPLHNYIIYIYIYMLVSYWGILPRWVTCCVSQSYLKPWRSCHVGDVSQHSTRRWREGISSTVSSSHIKLSLLYSKTKNVNFWRKCFQDIYTGIGLWLQNICKSHLAEFLSSTLVLHIYSFIHGQSEYIMVIVCGNPTYSLRIYRV